MARNLMKQAVLNIWRSLRFGIAIFQSKRPSDAAQDVLLIKLADFLRILAFEILGSIGSLNIFAMTERSVEDAAFAIFFAPGNRVIAGRFVVGMFVQHEEAVNFGAVEILHQINFVFQVPCRRQRFAGGIFCVLVDAIHFGLRVMLFEFSADHFDIRIHAVLAVKRVGGRMHSDESFAGFNPIEKGLLIRERQYASCIGKDYAVVIFERGGRHLLGHVGVCANEVDGEVAALLGQFAEDFFSGRNRAVDETFCDSHDQKLFGCRFQRSGKFKQVKAQSESKKQWPRGSDIHYFHMTVFGISSPNI